ncbi:universal stress protein [Halorhabdus rudnickae]|uniref:universal stress protein n=1 Tax=Halorhabdus rudnickae TaxID=1775544 RepID=UPI0010843058|nr:universal stress protein [Halorhabdus rudnickae]
MTRPSVLVPIRILEGESLPEGVPKLLANAHVVLLGYHVVPSQTAPGQARMQFEDRALDRLEEFETALADAGATIDHRLVFTHDAQQTIDRQITENDCLAALVPRALADLEDILVAVRGTVGIDRLARVVTGLFGDRDIDITLYHVTSADETDEDADVLLDGLTDRLVEAEIDPARIKTRTDRDVKPIEAIADLAETYDAVVMGESDPTLATFVFGMPADQVAERFLGPVLVVQREPTDGE